MLKDGGQLGIIIPDGLITSHRYRLFRENLIQNYKIKGIIELPSKVFSKTEAKTYILIIKKDKKTSRTVPVYLSNHIGEIIDKIMVRKEDLIQRMDFTYNSWNKVIKSTGPSLQDLGVSIIRGRQSKKELFNSGKRYLHTSDLKVAIEFLNVGENIFDNNLPHAKEGDIVISRVGKILGKVLYIEKGQVLISDCVYVIRTQKKFRRRIIQTLVSDYGQKWIQAHAHGVCAKVISKTDLYNFKLLS
jgi:type I restriction-modification system DNA methylase subunit